jgi:tRNA nucleotidyltransferase (CCA-adding enzyme)
MDVGHIHIQYPVDNPWISSTSMDVLAQHPWISIDIHGYSLDVVVVYESNCGLRE